MKAVDQDELQTITLSNLAGITDIFGRHFTRDFDELLTGLCGAPTKNRFSVRCGGAAIGSAFGDAFDIRAFRRERLPCGAQRRSVPHGEPQTNV